MIALANGCSHPGKFARVALTERGGTPHTSTLAKARASVKNSRAECCASANGSFCGAKCFESTFALLGRARMPVGVREMRPAEPLRASLTVLLGALVAGFVHARNSLTKLFLGFWSRRVHGVLRGTERGLTWKRRSPDRFHHADFIHAATGNIHPSVGCRRHVAHRASSRRNRGPGKLFCFWIELDDGVRLHSRFAVPNQAVRRDSDSVGTGVRSARGRPHLDGTVRGIEPAQISTLVVREINFVAGVNRNTARSRTFGQLVFGDLHCLRVDLSQLVGAEFAEKRNALAIDHNSVRPRIRHLHFL